MDGKEFSQKMNGLIPGCSGQNVNLWVTWAEECTAAGQYVDFVERPKDAAVSGWLDSFYASFYFVKSEFGEETAKRLIDLSASKLCLYPYEMKQAAEMLHNGCTKEQLMESMQEGALVSDVKFPSMKDVEQDLSAKNSGKEGKAMNRDKPPDGELMENEAVQQFFKLLMENRPEAGQDYSIMLWQMENMAHQLDAAMKELSEVKGQLAEMQESPVKKFVSHAVNAVEKRLHSMQEGLMDMKGRIIEGAKEAVAGVKQTGIKALDKAVSAMGIKKGLEAMQKNLSASMADIKNTIGKVEAVGQELRSAGEHLKNAGRAAAGKERKAVDVGEEGRFQAAILSPLRAERDILVKLNNLALAAIGNVERLEQAAGNALEEAKDGSLPAGQGMPEPDIELPPYQEKAMEHNAEKPSVLKDLKEKKSQAAAHAAPAPDKERKTQEAAL